MKEFKYNKIYVRNLKEVDSMKCPFCIKICSKCNALLVAYSSNFYKDKRGKYELASQCKECKKAYDKAYSKEHKNEIKAYQKTYNKQYSKEHKDELKGYQKQYYQNHIDELKAYHKVYDKTYDKQRWDKYLVDNGLQRGQGSIGEQLVRNALQDKHIEFIEQHTFSDCKYKIALRFDFYIPSINTVIEYDGIQHYEPVEWWGGEEYFKECKIRDEIKENYCKEHNINLIRIPYYEIDNIEDIIAMLI